MAIRLSEQIVNVFQKARMQGRDIRHWSKGRNRVLLLGLLAVLLASAALRTATPARAATIIDVPCGTPIDVSGNDVLVRLQPCTYPSMYFAGFPGALEGNGATIDLSNSTYGATVLGDITVSDIRVINGTDGGLWTPGRNVTLERVVVSGNRSTQKPAGGIWSSDGMQNLTLIDCTISDNVGRYGAGLWIHPDFNGGAIRILRSTVSGNHAVYTPGDGVSGLGGGVFVDYSVQRPSTLEITNSTISGNIADRIGGAMYLTGQLTAAINDTTITGNSAGQAADAIFDDTGGVPNPGVALRRSIVAGNGQDSMPDCGGGDGYHDFKRDYGYNVLVGACVGAFAPESTTRVVASNGAMLSVLANNGGLTKTHLPLAGSPVLNMIPAGSAGCTPGSTDQRGVSRPQSTGCDCGSVETKGAANRPPTITGTALMRTAGSPASNSQIASVADPEEASASLKVTVNGGASATVNGVTVSNLSVNSLGQVTASVVANCTATAAMFTLRVTDSGGLFAEATLNVKINSNSLPTLGTYPATSVTAGGAVTVLPSAAPSDNGSVASLTALAPGFTGTLTGNPATGAITIANANLPGNYTVSVTATDNCGAQVTRTLTLTVSSASNCWVTVNPVAIKQPYLGVSYFEGFSVTLMGNYTFSISAGKLPPGLQLLTVSGVTFISGTPTTAGTFNFTIKAKMNNLACEGARSYTVTIPATVANP